MPPSGRNSISVPSRRGSLVSQSRQGSLSTSPDIQCAPNDDASYNNKVVDAPNDTASLNDEVADIPENNQVTDAEPAPLQPVPRSLAYWSQAESLFASFKHKPFRSRRRSSYVFLSDELKLLSESSLERSGSYKYLQALVSAARSGNNLGQIQVQVEEQNKRLEGMTGRADGKSWKGESDLDLVADNAKRHRTMKPSRPSLSMQPSPPERQPKRVPSGVAFAPLSLADSAFHPTAPDRLPSAAQKTPLRFTPRNRSDPPALPRNITAS